MGNPDNSVVTARERASFERGERLGIEFERARCRATLTSPCAAGRLDMARVMACETNLPAARAIALMHQIVSLSQRDTSSAVAAMILQVGKRARGEIDSPAILPPLAAAIIAAGARRRGE